MQTRIHTNLSLAAGAFSTPPVELDVTRASTLTVQAVMAGSGGALVAADAKIFVKTIPNDGGSPGTNVPAMRGASDVPLANNSGRVEQFDVRGLNRVSIVVQNANATIAATANTHAYHSRDTEY